MAIKLELVLLNAVMLAAAAFYLSRLVAPRGVAAALLLMVVCTNFLERSAELRVDMLTGWAGLWSLLLLLDRRAALAGALCGVSFLMSQKGALYVVAASVALMAILAIKDLVVFNAACAAVVAAYVAFWSAIAGPTAVLHATFTSAAGQALNVAYAIRGHFWWQFILRNPLYVALTVAAIWILFARHRLVAVYAAVLLLEGALYTQPWPYFFVLLLPAFLVLHAHVVENLPRAAILALAIGGVIYPMLRIPIALARSNAYQRYNVRLASAMLGPDDTYLAGSDVVHDRRQPFPLVAHLDGQALDRLRRRGEPAARTIVAALDAAPPKLVIGNYRVYNLPPAVLRWIGLHYRRFSGSILG